MPRFRASSLRSPAQGGPGRDAARASALTAPDATLARYFGELHGYDLLDARQELELAREIERLEVELWRALLSHPAAAGLVAAAVAPHVRPRSAALAALGKLERAVAGSRPSARARARRSPPPGALIDVAARKLRAADVGRTGLRAADAHLRGRFAQDRGARRYHARVARARAAHDRAKHEFVTANLRLVIAMAHRYKQRVLPLADMIQEGNLGLMRAVERFDHRRGFRFSTYAAWWIRHSLNRALSDKARLVRVPVHTLDAVMRAQHLRDANAVKGLPPPEGRDLASQAGLSEQALAFAEAHAITRQPLSLDRSRSREQDQTLHDVLAAQDAVGPEEACDLAGRTHELRQLLGALSPVEAQILRLRFGLGGGAELTLRETGDRYGLSRERIRQIQEEALAKLRAMMPASRPRAVTGDHAAA
jgi:RNA polymerase primary sigma factor